MTRGKKYTSPNAKLMNSTIRKVDRRAEKRAEEINANFDKIDRKGSKVAKLFNKAGRSK